MLALFGSVLLFVAANDGGLTYAREGNLSPFNDRLPEDDRPVLPEGQSRPFLVTRAGQAFAVDNGSPRQWRFWSVAAPKPVLLAKADLFERAVGFALHDDGLVMAVVSPDRSSAYPLSDRVSALSHGDARQLAHMAGPPVAALVTLAPDGKEQKREVLIEQRPTGLCSTSDGWLVLLTEGSLEKGQSDAMIWARAPGASTGWQRLAVGLEMPNQLRCGGPWACSDEKTRGGEFRAHCVNPSTRTHLTSKLFKTNVLLRAIVEKPSWRLVFTELSVTGDVSPLWAMPLR